MPDTDAQFSRLPLGCTTCVQCEVMKWEDKKRGRERVRESERERERERGRGGDGGRWKHSITMLLYISITIYQMV